MRRETDDLDFFANRVEGDVTAVSDALVTAAEGHDWAVEVIRNGSEFRRLQIIRSTEDSAEELYIDLAIDSPPINAPIVTIAGPAMAPYELAVRKTLALFSRAEPRDFTDVHALHERFDRDEILDAAAQADPGLDRKILAQMLRSHCRLRDEDFPPSPATVDELRQYFDDWADEL